jgi:hypothetical protein
MLEAARKSSERLPEIARNIIAMRECSEEIGRETSLEPDENSDA